MSKVVASLFVLVLLAVGGCPADGPQQGESCPDEGTFAYDEERTVCVERTCPRDDSLDGAYESRDACREAEFDDLGDPDATDATDGSGGDAADGGPVDADDAEVSDTGGPDGEDAADAGADAESDTRDDDATDGGTNDGGSTDATDASDVSDGGAGSDTADAGDASGDTQLSCQDDYGTNSCFSNYDCASGERCENVRSESDPLSCCLTGDRGSKSAGETCNQDGQLACESGVCISKSGSDTQYCSKRCEQNEDCPEGMKDCTSVFGAADSWCFPE